MKIIECVSSDVASCGLQDGNYCDTLIVSLFYYILHLYPLLVQSLWLLHLIFNQIVNGDVAMYIFIFLIVKPLSL